MNPNMTDLSYGFSEEVRQFARQDECLMTIWRLWQVSSSSDHPLIREVREAALEHVHAHWPTCPLKVRQIAQVDPDPSRKRAYFWVMRQYTVSLMRAEDGEYRVIEGPDGWTCYWIVPSCMKTPFVATEAFQPRADDEVGYCIYEVDEALFKNPKPLIQWIDVTAASEVKDFPPEAGFLHTRSLFSHERFKLFVRWEGKLKPIAPGWTLHDRYGGLARKHLDAQATLHEQLTGATPEPVSVVDEVTALERMALEYEPDRAWFMGFLAYTLPKRLKDDWDKERRNPFSFPLQLDPDTQDGEPPVGFAEANRWSEELWRASEEERVLSSDRPRVLKEVWSHLDEIEQRVALLRADGLKDRQIAHELGCTRETVTRIRRALREKAKAVRAGANPGDLSRKRRRIKPSKPTKNPDHI